ncbi:MAG: DNA-3-methyladenine glycosylase [Verrucomicrobiota bacterium]
MRTDSDGRIIPAVFFRRDPVICARELIGVHLNWDQCSGIVVETEAYFAENDEACHTFNRPSARHFIERNKAGAAYVYFTYGAHWMLNALVKGKENGFVLIRALEPLRGIALMKKRRGVNEEGQLCSGPGKLTQALGITSQHHEIDLCSDPRHHFSAQPKVYVDVVADARIGITRSMHHPWRFTLRDSRFVSRRARPVDPS